MKISASFLGVKNIGETLRKLSVTDVDYIHLDVMDGKYTIKKTLSFKEFKSITNYTKKRLDVHLMVKNPLKMIDDYATLNVEYLTVHMDSGSNLLDVFDRLSKYGIKKGLAVNPKDDIEKVYDYLDKIDLVLVMSVYPGLPGQTFIDDTYPKIEALRNEIKKRKLKTLISVDGGINLENVKNLKDVDIIVSGTTITSSDNFQETITALRNWLKKKKT